MKLSQVLSNVKFGTPLCIEDGNGKVMFDGVWAVLSRPDDFSGDVDYIGIGENRLYIKLW